MDEPIPEDIERIGAIVVDAAVKVHREPGPGLLEKVYELCLCHELTRRGLKLGFVLNFNVPVMRKGIKRVVL